MRSILVAMLVAGGLGLVAPSPATAAPVTGSGAREAGTLLNPVEQVQHWRWGSGGGGGHWRWGSGGGGGHWRWGSGGGGHWRWGSRGGGHWRWGSRGRLCHYPYSSVYTRC